MIVKDYYFQICRKEAGRHNGFVWKPVVSGWFTYVTEDDIQKQIDDVIDELLRGDYVFQVNNFAGKRGWSSLRYFKV